MKGRGGTDRLLWSARHWHLAAPGELEQPDNVSRPGEAVRQPRPRHRNCAEVDLGRGRQIEQGNRIVQAGVGVDDDGQPARWGLAVAGHRRRNPPAANAEAMPRIEATFILASILAAPPGCMPPTVLTRRAG